MAMLQRVPIKWRHETRQSTQMASPSHVIACEVCPSHLVPSGCCCCCMLHALAAALSLGARHPPGALAAPPAPSPGRSSWCGPPGGACSRSMMTSHMASHGGGAPARIGDSGCITLLRTVCCMAWGVRRAGCPAAQDMRRSECVSRTGAVHRFCLPFCSHFARPRPAANRTHGPCLLSCP